MQSIFHVFLFTNLRIIFRAILMMQMQIEASQYRNEDGIRIRRLEENCSGNFYDANIITFERQLQGTTLHILHFIISSFSSTTPYFPNNFLALINRDRLFGLICKADDGRRSRCLKTISTDTRSSIFPAARQIERALGPNSKPIQVPPDAFLCLARWKSNQHTVRSLEIPRRIGSYRPTTV